MSYNEGLRSVIMELSPMAMRQLREDAKLSLRDLHNACGVAISFLHGMELGKGNPSIDTLRRILAVYGMDIAIVKQKEPTVL